MSTSFLLLIVAVIGVAGYLIGSRRANALASGKLSNLHSRPGYYGSFVAIWAMLPAIGILLVWLVASPLYISSTVRAGFPDEVKAEPQATQNLNYNMIGAIARGFKLLTSRSARPCSRTAPPLATYWPARAFRSRPRPRRTC